MWISLQATRLLVGFSPIIDPLWVAVAELLSTTRSPDATMSSSLHHHVGKGSIHHAADLLQAFKAARHWSTEVMDKVLGVEEMVHSIYIVLVLEYSGEIPDNLLVAIFLLHLIAPFHDVE